MAARYLLPGVKRNPKKAARNPSAGSYEAAKRKVLRRRGGSAGRSMNGKR